MRMCCCRDVFTHPLPCIVPCNHVLSYLKMNLLCWDRGVVLAWQEFQWNVSRRVDWMLKAYCSNFYECFPVGIPERIRLCSPSWGYQKISWEDSSRCVNGWCQCACEGSYEKMLCDALRSMLKWMGPASDTSVTTRCLWFDRLIAWAIWQWDVY